MNQYSVPRTPKGKVVVCSLAAAIFGLLYPLLLMLRLFIPVLTPSFSAMIVIALYAAAGFAPVITFGAAMLVSCAVGFGPLIGIAALPVIAVPVVVTVLGIRGKLPFFRQMSRAIVANILGTVLSVTLAAVVFGTDMIASLINEMQAIFEQMMPMLWEAQGSLFESAGIQITYDEFASMQFDALKVLQQYYETYLPGNLLTGAAITAVISVLWGNWLSARRGAATTDSFIGLCDWYLPSNMTFGMLMTLVVALVISRTAIAGAQTTWIAVSSLVEFAFVVQGFAAMDRRQKAAGASRKRRTGLIVLFCILGAMTSGAAVLNIYFVMAIAGAGSALFGRRGAARMLIDKNKEK